MSRALYIQAHLCSAAGRWGPLFYCIRCQTAHEFICRLNGLTIDTTFKNNNEVGELRLFDLKVYQRAPLIKTAWYWHRDRNMDQLKRTESLEIGLNRCGQLIFSKHAKLVRQGKIVFSTNGAEAMGLSYAAIEMIPDLIVDSKLNSKYIIDLNVTQTCK